VVISNGRNPLARPPPADRILLVRPGSLGAVARALPAASALRAGYPGAQLAWLVERAGQRLLAGQPWVDEQLLYPTAADAPWSPGAELRALRRSVDQLRSRRFDLVIDFRGGARSALLTRLSGARVRVAQAGRGFRGLGSLATTHGVRPRSWRATRFERAAALVEFLGIGAPPDPRPLRVPSALLARVRALLGARTRPLAIHPGTGAAAADERYPVECWARVARTLSHEDGVGCVVSWGAARDDRRLAEALVAAAPGAARLAPETRSPAELAALFASCRIVAASETGPLHVASLVGTPVVQLLGPLASDADAPWSGTPFRSLRSLPVGGGVWGARPASEPAAVVAAIRSVLAEGAVAEARLMPRAFAARPPLFAGA
jgi:ADP-heptose:LPS heptosyltransferase